MVFSCCGAVVSFSLPVVLPTAKVTLVNADNRPAATVVAAMPLGNYSEAAGYSAPVAVSAAGLRASCAAGIGAQPRPRLFLQLQPTNNDRPVLLAVDDMAGGFNASVGFGAAADDDVQ